MSQNQSQEEEAALRAALDAALDDMGEDVSDEEEDDASVIDDLDHHGDENLDNPPAEDAVNEELAVMPQREVAGNEVCEATGEVEVASVSGDDSPTPAKPVVLDAKLMEIADDSMTASSQEPRRQQRDTKSKSQQNESETPEKHQPTHQSPKVTETSVQHHPGKTKPVSTSVKSTGPLMGPPRPPSSSSNKKKKSHPTDPDKLFMEMMEDMLLTEQEGVTGPDEMMMRLVQQLQEQLHELELEDQEDAESEKDAIASSENLARGEITFKEVDPPTGRKEESTAVSGYAAPFETETRQEPVRVESLPPKTPPLGSPQTDVPNFQRLSAPDLPDSGPPSVAGEERANESVVSQPLSPESKLPNKPKAKLKPKSTSKRRNGNVPSAPAPSSVDTQYHLDAAISQLIQGMAQQASMDDSLDELGANGDVKEAELLNLLMKGLQGVGSGDDDEGIPDDDFNADAMIDGMMEQLLSKDLMYEPMKQVALRFPKWLDENRQSLSKQEMQQRERQCECFQKLVHVYETRPGNTTELMALMQEVQEYGQPPSDIIREIAPGLELDANGLPKLNDSLPSMPGGGGGDECRVM